VVMGLAAGLGVDVGLAAGLGHGAAAVSASGSVSSARSRAEAGSKQRYWGIWVCHGGSEPRPRSSVILLTGLGDGGSSPCCIKLSMEAVVQQEW
jgi:hypothetical protein